MSREFPLGTQRQRKGRKMMITPEEYTSAINKLIKLAAMECGTSSAAAVQVLLSAYSGYDWQLSVVDLCALDSGHFKAALTVVAGRWQGIAEPHAMIEDGSAIFGRLQDRWAEYHVHNRWKHDCYGCRGLGYVFESDDDYEKDIRTRCYRCSGTGRIAEVQGLKAKIIDTTN